MFGLSVPEFTALNQLGLPLIADPSMETYRSLQHSRSPDLKECLLCTSRNYINIALCARWMSPTDVRAASNLYSTPWTRDVGSCTRLGDVGAASCENSCAVAALASTAAMPNAYRKHAFSYIGSTDTRSASAYLYYCTRFPLANISAKSQLWPRLHVQPLNRPYQCLVCAHGALGRVARKRRRRTRRPKLA